MRDIADSGRSERKSGYRDGASEVRTKAVEALGKLGEHAAPAVPALTKCLEHDNATVRRGWRGSVWGKGARGHRHSRGV